MRIHKLDFSEMAIPPAKIAAVFLCILSVLLAYGGLGRTQERQLSSRQNSELGRENLSRAAASAADLKAILIKDAGLMVELKRWIAKDATGHGQIISDNDLTDEAIFDRLELDVQFRSIATLLVQRYGYLVPKLNPESEAAKTRELLVQERTKWLAQAQEQERALASQKRMGKVQNAANCDSQLDEQCNSDQKPTDERSPENQRQQENLPPSNMSPNDFNYPSRPRTDSSQVLRAQYGQYGEDMDDFGGGGLSQLPLGGMSEAASSFNLSSRGSGDASTLRASMSEDGQSRSLMSMSNSGDRSMVDALATYGVGAGRPDTDLSELTRLSPDTNSLMPSGSRNLGSSSNNPSSFNSMSLFERRRRPKPVPSAPELVRAASPYNDIPSLYDMYIQAIPRPTVPRRFGIEVFQNGTRDSQLIPMDLPAGPDYVVGPGDGLSIDLWGGVSQRIYRVVDREGRVSLPEVGPLLVSGKSLAEVQANL